MVAGHVMVACLHVSRTLIGGATTIGGGHLTDFVCTSGTNSYSHHRGKSTMAKLVRAGILIDGTSGEPIPQGCLLIEGDRIKYVGPPGGVHTPPGAEVLDLTAFTVLPGLIDAHSHLGPFFGEDLSRLHPHEELYRMGTASRHLRLMLASGVTTMRNPSERSWLWPPSSGHQAQRTLQVAPAGPGLCGLCSTSGYAAPLQPRASKRIPSPKQSQNYVLVGFD